METPEEQLAGKNILVVDDDPRNVFALTNYLELLGIHILTSENGFEAIRMLQQRDEIDLVLMDMMMPEMDGYETIGKIRGESNLEMSTVPIIAVTAKAMKGDREKCLEAGADEYVSKPVNLQELIEKMASCLAASNR